MTHALELQPRDAFIYKQRGDAKYLKRDWTDALSDYRRACELIDQSQAFPRIGIWLIRAQLGEIEAANKDLAAYRENGERSVNAVRYGEKVERYIRALNAWDSSIAEYLLGQMSEDDLIAATKSPKADEERGRLCQAWFYTGMKRWLIGEKIDGIDRFKKCLATEKRAFPEYQFAQFQLEIQRQREAGKK